ncbi:HAD family hydrolase [Chitinophaga sp. MM2321]|uniref:HAD family hydrolase n=1 Tax=Chitinophaga sp. MM2321 TaxID=3137178 RepID=UPI0032D57D18
MTIAFFDFDGTITRKDTLWEIIRFHKGRAAMYTGMARLLPALLLFKMKQIPAQEMKERVLKYYFGEMTEQEFISGCEKFCQQRLPVLIREQALTAIRNHQQQGHRVVVVTASAQHWVAPWCNTENIGCIGSRMEVKDQYITGNLVGINCNGEEKVARIKQEFDLTQFNEIFAYGDSKGDKPMLALAQHAAYKPFRS